MAKTLDDLDQDDADPTEIAFDWGRPGQRPFGCTERQVLFARARLAGYTQTQAAEKAGYQGDEATLRAQGSRAAHSPRVRALLEAAGKADSVGKSSGDAKELRDLLWNEARQGANPSSRVRSMELLTKYFDQPQPAQPLEAVSDMDLLLFLEETSKDPLWLALMALFARSFPPDSFSADSPLKGYRMPASAWDALRRLYPEVADALDRRGCGGSRERQR